MALLDQYPKMVLRAPALKTGSTVWKQTTVCGKHRLSSIVALYRRRCLSWKQTWTLVAKKNVN